MASEEEEVQLQKQLQELGSKLENPPASTHALITLLTQAARTLTKMEQSPPKAVLDTMQTLLNAIVKPELLKHQDEEAKLLVATCICEITRITAPEAPYDDDVLKDIFRLFVSTFNGLRDTKDPSFKRRVHILHTFAKLRYAAVMLDLECDELVNEMFKTFFAVASDEHPEVVLVGMKRILTVLLEESEEIGEDLLLIILSILGRNKKDITPAARRLAMSVIKECAGQLEPGIEQFILSPKSKENRYSNPEFDYREFLYDIFCCTPPTLLKVLQRVTEELEIELSTPSDGKQSTVATSALKRTKQTNLDNDDNNSSPSKKSKDEALLDDSSERINGASAGQCEGLDSEFGKTENLCNGKKVRGKRGKCIEQAPAVESSKKKGRLANEPKSLNIDKGATDDSVKTTSQEIMEKDVTKDMALPFVMGLQCNEMTVTQGKLIQKSSTEISPSVAEGDTNQLDVLSAPSTVVVKEGKEEDAATVAPKRKRGRPPKLQPKSLETPVTVEYHQNGGVGPAEISVVEGAQVTEVSSPTSPGIKLVEKSQEPVKEPNENTIKEPNENPEQDASAQRGKKKYSSAKGRRGKRRTISVNESLAQDIQDASKEKTDGSLETKDPEASAVQSVDLDDQPFSTWIEVHSPVPFNGPVGTSTTSERQLEIVACDIDADIPFVKTTPLWHTIESMEAFRKLPQNPHFRPLLKGVKESAREGMAIGTMVTFSTVVGRTYCLRVDGPRSAIGDCLETLVELESNGFDVEVIRDRLTRLLLLKDKQEELADRSKGVVEKIEEQKMQEKTINDEVDEIDRQIRQLEDTRRKVLQKKEKWTVENDAMKAAEEAIEQELREVAAKFDGLAAAPL
ncbi:Agenet-like domain-containing protein [Artemisia annua]|uniref:Agenet-like domain-containing protein n=1 Tax=Artemisia annua TaxID=35608 RepID=A0A2U1PEL1_ARTAN|nr:Agenet-like domain-containing protein [Artemisia annua]